MAEELQKINKEKLEQIYTDDFDIDEILENELEAITVITNKIEAKIIALQHHRRINQDA